MRSFVPEIVFVIVFVIVNQINQTIPPEHGAIIICY